MASSNRLAASLLHRHRSSAALTKPLLTPARTLFRHHPLRLPVQQTRNRYQKRTDPGWDAAIRSAYGKDSSVFLLQDTTRDLAKAGLDTEAALMLLYIVVMRAATRWDPDTVYATFHNYVRWKKDPTSVPTKWQNPIFYYFHAQVIENEEYDRAHLNTLPPDKVSEALLILAKQNLRMAFSRYDESETIFSTDLVLAIFLLEIAIRYRNIEAAVLLLNISQDVAVKCWNDERSKQGHKSIMPNVSGAKGLIRESVARDPSRCDWRSIVTYMRDEYRESNITRQTPNQLAWAIDILLLVVEDLEPGRTLEAEHIYSQEAADTSFTIARWQQCENPWRVLHRIVSHCLRTKASLPNYSVSELLRLQENCLSELLRYNDPNASFITAIRDRRPATEDWEDLIKCAAAGGISDANWLLASFYLAQNRFLGPVEKLHSQDRERTQLAALYAGVATYLSLAEAPTEQSQLGRETVCVNRILAHTALMKTISGYKVGEEALRLHLRDVRGTPGVASGMIARLQKHYDDYMQTDKMLDEHWGWSEERCLDMIRTGFNMDRTCQVARRSRNYWHHPT